MTEKEDIRNLVKEYLKETECFLVDVKLSPGKLTVAIDKPEGVKLEECALLTRFTC
jgi:ribosome maturation factor RimP